MASLATIQRIEAALTPPDLFSPSEDAAKLYRRLARECHPDPITEPALKARAEAAFAKLSGFYSSLTAPPAATIGKWEVLRPLVKGGICDLHLVRSGATEGVLKIVRSAEDNLLLERERLCLKKLHADNRSENFKRYIPSLPQCFEASDRRVNVMSLAADCFSLSQIRGWLPSGVPFRHIVWMMNRTLDLLGFAHQNGVIHGAILPHHLLFRPTDHGLVVIDWTAAVKFPSEDHIPYIVSRWKERYPSEVQRKDCFCSTDIFMAAQAMRYAAESIPRRFKALFEWCEAESPSARPESAWALQDRWKKLAEEEYGAPKFVPFNLPVN